MKDKTEILSAVAPEKSSDGMLNKKELAAKLKVTVRTIENWQASGLLPYLKISRVVLFHWPDVIEHLNKNFRVCRRGTLRPGSESRRV
jgi:phage terminase Nu1 subunit (DNA packaging protein)